MHPLRKPAILTVLVAASLAACSPKIEPNANLSGRDLSGRDMTSADLSGADLSGADLQGATLDGATLVGANLSGADLQGATLDGATLVGTNLSGADLQGATLDGATLVGADLAWANLTLASLEGAVLTGVDLSATALGGANLAAADLREANLGGVDLSTTAMAGANLAGARLEDANLAGVDLTGFNLAGAQMSGCDLTAAVLVGVNLSAANLANAILSDAELEGAVLEDAILSGAVLPGVDLSGTALARADLGGASLSGGNMSGLDLTTVRLTGADLNGASLVGVVLTGVDMTSLNLEGADLSGADLSSANLTGLDVGGALLTDANLRGAILDQADLGSAEGLTEEMVLSAASWEGTRVDTPSEIQSAMVEVCRGNGVPEATRYSEGDGPHPMVVLSDTGGYHVWGEGVPDAWNSLGVPFTELVACVALEEETRIQVCPYNGPDIERFRYQVTVRLRSASTGSVVAAGTLRGDPPRECRSSEPYYLFRLEGTHVTYEQFADWLTTYQGTPEDPGGGQVAQFATGATASSQYSDSSWSAMQATGAPDTSRCASLSSAWASLSTHGQDWLHLTYDQPVLPTRIEIYQTSHPGAVTRVEVLDEAGDSYALYEADPTPVSECPYMLAIMTHAVTAPVNAIRITLDQSNHDGWNEIDAVRLVGEPGR